MLAHFAKPVLVKKKVSEEPSRSSWRTLGGRKAAQRAHRRKPIRAFPFLPIASRDAHVRGARRCFSAASSLAPARALPATSESVSRFYSSFGASLRCFACLCMEALLTRAVYVRNSVWGEWICSCKSHDVLTFDLEYRLHKSECITPCFRMTSLGCFCQIQYTPAAMSECAIVCRWGDSKPPAGSALYETKSQSKKPFLQELPRVASVVHDAQCTSARPQHFVSQQFVLIANNSPSVTGPYRRSISEHRVFQAVMIQLNVRSGVTKFAPPSLSKSSRRPRLALSKPRCM